MDFPTITVVMPVYNGEKHLEEAIESVLNQSFKDFEFIIINDGSTDRSTEIIESYFDKRIRLFTNSKNMGVSYCRNLGLREARGKYLTWCDCDDINMPERFYKQVEFMERNKAIGGCGTWVIRFKGNKKLHITKIFNNPEVLKATMLFKPSIPNATIMLRTSEIRKNNILYNDNLKIGEDYDFILSCSMYFDFDIITKPLYKYRDSEISITKKYESQPTEHFNNLKTVHKKALSFIGITPTDSEAKIHVAISSTELFDSIKDYKACYYWLKLLKYKNQETKLYNEVCFEKVLSEQFYFISKKASRFGMPTLFFYISKSYTDFSFVSLNEFIKLIIRCVIKYNKF